VSYPRVSIVMPVYNGARFIAEALASLQSEPGIDAEIIVVDDGSTDDTMVVVSSISAGDARIRVLSGEHKGVSSARNIGVRAASGQYITFLDSDDICPPGRIARQAQRLAGRPDAAAVIGETLLFEELTKDLQPAPGTRYLQIFTVMLHCALFHRDVFDRLGLFDETLSFSEDFDFFLRLAEAEMPLVVETEIASLYRRHPGSMTTDTAALRAGILAALQRSLARRRNTGRTAPYSHFLTRRMAAESMFAAGPALAGAAGHLDEQIAR
jgi:glycosyltransferase involved in cell wall biosynthesis